IYWSAPMLSSRKTLSFAAKRPGIGRFLPFILILLVSSSSLLSAAEPAERIAAVVNGEIIFLSDLERYRLFFEPLEKKTETPADPMKILEAMINRRLLLKEARRFILEGPTEEETDQRLKRVRQRFKDEPAFLQALDRTGFSLEELKGEIRGELWVERLLQERVQSFIFITPRQVEQYYQGNAEEFKGKKLPEVEPVIRKRLTEEREALKTREYLARLREHADIQINLAVREPTSPAQSSPIPPAH
ncbi:MAG TPA: hypothetical protein VFA47_03635, partial [Candidatus Manganitrophaceae bacterium]|nr:hypothetical protein [Candidatus Manganitrophaceae bacterium]